MNIKSQKVSFELRQTVKHKHHLTFSSKPYRCIKLSEIYIKVGDSIIVCFLIFWHVSSWLIVPHILLCLFNRNEPISRIIRTLYHEMKKTISIKWYNTFMRNMIGILLIFGNVCSKYSDAYIYICKMRI